MVEEKSGDKINSGTVNLLPHDGEACFMRGFLPSPDADNYLQQLTDEIAWRQEPIKIFGKTVMQPRLTAWYGEEGKAYSYSGITMQPLPWTTALSAIKERAEAIVGKRFNSALLNFYRDGKDSMGWHRDNEKELGIDPVIASVNLGATRTFRFRNYHDKREIISLELTHGSLLLMQGPTQHHWEHSLPKTIQQISPRINITFRIIT